MKKIILIAGALCLAGCAEYKTAKPVDVDFAQGADTNVQGYHPLPVRAFLGGTSQQNEISGVPCKVEGSGFQANIYTPAAVNIPVYGLKSKAIYVECTYNEQVKSKSLVPVNITEENVVKSGASVGLVGLLVTSAVVATRKDKQFDEYGYHNVNIVFKKEKAQEAE